MADKQIEIELVTKVDLSDAEELVDKINEIKELTSDGVGLDASSFNDAKAELAEATAEVERLKEELDFAEEWGFANDVEELESQLAEAEAEVEALSDALGNVDASSMVDASSSVEELEAQLNEAEAVVEALSDALSNIDSSNTNNISEDFDNISNSASDATNNVDGLQSSMDILEAGALMSISSELANMGAGAEGMAQEMNAAAISVGQLATNVGVAEPQMVSLINNISNATFPQEEALAYANALNQMGVSADQLGTSATNMDRINDATGIGYQKVMQLTQGLQAVGVSANNLPSSFNAIAYAQANVNGGADTLSMVLKRQASTINEYGLNVDQLVVMMQALSAQGVQGMKMGSELSKVLKDNNGDIAAVEKSLGLQAGALSNASDLTGQYSGQLQDLATEEAEHKTFLDQINAAWEDMQLSLSPVLGPLTSVMGLIGNAGSFAVGLNGLIQLANTMRGLSIVTYAKAAADKAAAAAQWLLNIAMDANPVMLVVIAIIALIAVLGYLYFNNEQVRAAIDALGATFMNIAQILYNSIINAVQMLANQFNNFTQQLGLNTNDWRQAVLGFIVFIATMPLQIGAVLANTIARALGFKGNFVQTLISTASNAVQGFVNAIQSIPQALQQCLQWAYNIVMNSPLGKALKWLGEQGAWAFSVFGLGQRSPGKIVRAMQQELDWTEEAVSNSDLPSATAKLGSNMVSSFNLDLESIGIGNNLPLSFNLDLNSIGNNMPFTFNTDFETANSRIDNESTPSQVNNFYFNDVVVDNEDRMKRIVDYVTKSIRWNNKTAGRTI